MLNFDSLHLTLGFLSHTFKNQRGYKGEGILTQRLPGAPFYCAHTRRSSHTNSLRPQRPFRGIAPRLCFVLLARSPTSMEIDWTQPAMKVASLLVSAFSVHLSLSPPNPPVRKEECYCQKENVNTFFETFIQYITFCSKVRRISSSFPKHYRHEVLMHAYMLFVLEQTMVWLGVTAELLFSTLSYAPPSITVCPLRWLPASRLTLLSDPPPWTYQCSPILILGAFLTMTGALLRLWYVESRLPLTP